MREVSENRVYKFGPFRLDAGHLLLFRDSERVNLTPKVVETLLVLIESSGEVVSKDELMNALWPETTVEESNLSQNIYVLRKVLGSDPDGNPFIETLRRRGYRFCGEVVRADPVFRTPGEPRPLRIERSDNLYSVVDWQQRQTINNQNARESRSSRPTILAAAVILLLVALGGVVYQLRPTGTVNRSSEIPFYGRQISRVTASGRSKLAAISPDGGYIAHVTADGDGENLWIRQTSAANDIRLAGPVDSEIVSVTFSTDGRSVYYASIDRSKGETELYKVPVLGGPSVIDAHDTGPIGLGPGGKIAFMRYDKDETRLFVANADGGSEKIVMSLLKPQHFVVIWNAPVWMADGRSIVCPVHLRDEFGEYETLMAIDVQSGVARKLTEKRWHSVGQPRLAADGIMLTAAETSVSPRQIWHVALSNGSATRITNDLANYGEVSVTSDGRRMTAIQEQTMSGIWIVENDDSSNAKQLRPEVGTLNDVIWLADGRLAFISSAGGSPEIWVMGPDGANARQLTVGANVSLGLAATPDGKHLVFSADKNGRTGLWRIGIDGSDLTQITNGEGEVWPQITPDGLWIIYQAGLAHPTVRKMPFAGGESTPVTTMTAGRPSISPDGKYVAYHYLDSSFEDSRWSIGVSRLEDGKQLYRFDLPGTVIERMAKWSPDGRSIAFASHTNGAANVWQQSLSGGSPKALTDFRSDTIFDFNWPPDGKRLAVVRGTSTSDVVLIDTGP